MMGWWKIGLLVFGVIVLGLLAMFFNFARPILGGEVDENNLPQFIQAHFMDLDDIATISKFRSGSGHDFSGGGETCRSMKHYVTPPIVGDQRWQPGDPAPPPAPGTGYPIYSPVTGTITEIGREKTDIGRQIRVRPNAQPAFVIRLFHVFPKDDLKVGSRVTAGEEIGRIRDDQGTDIAVQIFTLKGEDFFSYFQVMPDELFADYLSRGVSSRSDLILTKEQRDAKPLQCHGEQFAQNYQRDPSYDEIVYLNGYSRDRFESQYRQPNHR